MDERVGIAPGHVVRAIARNWWLFVLRGIAAILFGILTLVWPGITITALVILFGAYALVDGIGSLWSSARHRGDRNYRTFSILEGIAAVALGVLTLIWPGITALALLLLIGAWAVVTGIAEIAAAIRLRKMIRGEWFLALTGVLSIAAGIVIFVRPGAGALGIAIVIGIYALLFGAVLVALGLRLRRLEQGHTPHTSAERPAA
jgi:uncharacterized membrane protein HdeD (DUF308 family)